MRKSLLSLAIGTALCATTMAQPGPGEWEYIPAVERDVKAITTHGIGTDGRYAITWIGGTAKGAPMRFDVYDREGLNHATTKNIEWPGSDHYIERWIEWGGSTYLITLDNDAKADQVVVKAQAYQMPELTPQGEAILLGALPISGFSTSFWGAGLRFERSPEESKLAVVFDRLIDKKGGRLVACWVFDERFNAVQQAIIDVKGSSIESDVVRTLTVADDGTAHMIISADLATPEGKSGDRGHVIYRLQNGTVNSFTLRLPGEGSIISASMVPDGEELLVAGFYRASGKEGGRYHAHIPMDLGTEEPLTLDPFPGDALKFIRAQVLLDGNDGFYLIGNACLAVNADLQGQVQLNVNAYAVDGIRSWTYAMLRNITATKNDQNGFFAVASGKELVLLIPDIAANVEIYNANKPPKGSAAAHKVVHVRFDPAGKPTYSLFGAPSYTMLYQGLSLLPDGHTVFQHAAPIDSKSDRNQAYAFVDLWE